MKKTISDVVSELETIKKLHVLNDDFPLVSMCGDDYTIDDVLYVLRNNSTDDELYKAVKEGILFL